VTLFLVGFAAFFSLRVIGGLLHRAAAYPARQDMIFTLPIVVAIALWCFPKSRFFYTIHDASFFLFPAWLLTVLIWWSVDIRWTGRRAVARSGPSVYP
jgi:hypothetical protein